MVSKLYFLFVLSFIPFGFFTTNPESKTANTSYLNTRFFSDNVKIQPPDSISELEQILKTYGLINIKTLDSTILVNLKYAQEDNFLKENLYGNFSQAYLQKDAAEMLAEAQKQLKAVFPHYTLVVLDAARPASIQQKMWASDKISAYEKSRFLASPGVGSLHSYGASVDITIADGNGNYLDMGTPFDTFDELSYPSLEKALEKEGKLKPEQLANRHLLRTVMKKAGFTPIQTEWWHFNSASRVKARTQYPLIVSHIFAENKFSADKLQNSELTRDEKKPSIEFRIQIKSSSKALSLSDPIFKGLTVSKYKHENLFRYTVGVYKDIAEARDMKLKMWEMGFSDAFIAAFNHGRRIGIMDAMEFLNQAEEKGK